MTRRTQPLRAVVFDLDGTLVDSLPLVLRAIAHAIEPFGPRPTMEIFARLGGPPERFLPDLLTDAANAPAAIKRMEDYHQRNQHLVQPFDGAGAALERLRSQGLKLAIWTGRDRTSGEELLGMLGLKPHFDAIVYGDDFPTHKPDPEGLRAILGRLGVPAGEAIMVGDADVDILGGVAAGMDTVLIRHAREVPDDLRAKTWRTVASPREAYALLHASVGPGGAAPAK